MTPPPCPIFRSGRVWLHVASGAVRPRRDYLRAASAVSGSTIEDVTGPSRRRDLALPRMAAMAIARGEGLTLPVVARLFGRDHTTVLHAVARSGDDDLSTCIREVSAALARIARERAALEGEGKR